MLYHEKDRKNKENAHFIHIVYLLAKLGNSFGEAFLLTSVYFKFLAWSIVTHISYENDMNISNIIVAFRHIVWFGSIKC